MQGEGPAGAKACLFEEQDTKGHVCELSFEGLPGVIWVVDHRAGRRAVLQEKQSKCVTWELKL